MQLTGAPCLIYVYLGGEILTSQSLINPGLAADLGRCKNVAKWRVEGSNDVSILNDRSSEKFRIALRETATLPLPDRDRARKDLTAFDSN
jgi:hypothetical protein